MTFEQSIPMAKQLAERALEKGFDVEAFLVLAEIQKLQPSEDLVEESGVDEDINDISKLFVKYFYNRSIQNLESLLISIRQMLSELYHTVETEEERELFRSHLSNLSDIISTYRI